MSARPPVVLLHPIGFNSSFWAGATRYLQSEHRVIAPDFRGHGASVWGQEPFTLRDLVDDVVRVIDAEAGGCAVLVGLSLGAMVALTLVADHPERVRALVVADTHFEIHEASAQLFERRARAAESAGMAAVVDESLQRWFSVRAHAARPELINAARRSLLAMDPLAHAQTWRTLGGLDVATRLPDIVVPVLVINGSEDIATTPAAGRELASRLPNARAVELTDAGHMSALEQPEAFAGVTLEFLRTLTT